MGKLWNQDHDQDYLSHPLCKTSGKELMEPLLVCDHTSYIGNVIVGLRAAVISYTTELVLSD